MIPFAFFHNFVRPEGTLNFSDVCLPEEEHTNAGLTDTSPDGKRNFLVDDCFNGETIVNVVFGYTGFLYAVDAIGQPGCFGNDEQILLCSRFDNLGKGASGAAVQNMNIMLGKE